MPTGLAVEWAVAFRLVLWIGTVPRSSIAARMGIRVVRLFGRFGIRHVILSCVCRGAMGCHGSCLE